MKGTSPSRAVYSIDQAAFGNRCVPIAPPWKNAQQRLPRVNGDTETRKQLELQQILPQELDFRGDCLLTFVPCEAAKAKTQTQIIDERQIMTFVQQ